MSCQPRCKIANIWPSFRARTGLVFSDIIPMCSPEAIDSEGRIKWSIYVDFAPKNTLFYVCRQILHSRGRMIMISSVDQRWAKRQSPFDCLLGSFREVYRAEPGDLQRLFEKWFFVRRHAEINSFFPTRLGPDFPNDVLFKIPPELNNVFSSTLYICEAEKFCRNNINRFANLLAHVQSGMAGNASQFLTVLFAIHSKRAKQLLKGLCYYALMRYNDSCLGKLETLPRIPLHRLGSPESGQSSWSLRCNHNIQSCVWTNTPSRTREALHILRVCSCD